MAPSITGVTPAAVAWLATLQISGTALLNTTVTIGGVAVTVTSATSIGVAVEVGGDVPVGLHTVDLTTPFGSDTATVTVTGIAPTITSAIPNPVRLTETLTITGTALANVTDARVSGLPASVEWNTASEVGVRVPNDVTPGPGHTMEITTQFGADSVVVAVLAAPASCCGMVGRDAGAKRAALWLLLLAFVPVGALAARRRLA